jgi:enoyl-CoA hydratase
MSDYQHILFEKVGPVARIYHDRPEVRNAEDTLLLQEMDDAFSRCAGDDTVKVVILGGTGDHFSAGHDLKEGQGRSHFSVDQRYAYELKNYFGYCLNIWDFPKPTIAQVQGACIAGGFMVANMCDLMVASEDAYFMDPVVRSLGVCAVVVLIHPWVLGMRKAKEMLYTGQRITAAEGLQYGMINRVVPRDRLEDATMELAQHIADTDAMFTLQLMKRTLNRTADMQGFRNALLAHFDTHQIGHVTEKALAVRAHGLSKSIGMVKSTT